MISKMTITFLACIAILVTIVTSQTPPSFTTCTGSVNTLHPHFVCLTVVDATGAGYTSYQFFVNGVASGNPVFTANTTNHFIGNLLGSTTYSITIAGILPTGVQSAQSSPTSITTAPNQSDSPIQNPAIDISAVACASTPGTKKDRTTIKCSWINPSKSPLKVVITGNCTGGAQPRISGNRKVKNIRIEKISVRGKTSATFQVARNPAICTIIVRARYNVPSGFDRVKTGDFRAKGGAKKFVVLKGKTNVISVNIPL